MISRLKQWFLQNVMKINNSIAFLPALIAIVFLGLSAFMIYIDFSDTGKQIKSDLHWLRLRDPATARSIISSITAGIISLAVFSFTMVMIMLNQAASQMSNRILDKLIGNTFQQVVLGIYIGTIVYSLFLLSTIRDIDDGIYVPALSTYLLIALTIVDIFLFIYFLHYITQSVKYEVIIHRIYKQTKKELEKTCRLSTEQEEEKAISGSPIPCPATGIFTGYNRKALLQLTEENNFILSFTHPIGTFILKGNPVVIVSAVDSQSKIKEDILPHIIIDNEDSIDHNFVYGFKQLTEVAVRALSPGMNDPGTAVVSVRALSDLLAYRSKHFPDLTIKDKHNIVRIITKEKSFEELFTAALFPIWDYGKNDRLIQHEMQHVLEQLMMCNSFTTMKKLYNNVQLQMEKAVL